MNCAVIIPFYNSAATLSQAIKSAVQIPGFSVFVSDDSSTDPECTRIVRKFSDRCENLRYALNCPRRGVSAARNLVLERVVNEDRCEYVIFLDADDVLTLPRFEPAGDCMIFGGGPGTSQELFCKELLSPLWNKIFRLDRIRELNLRFREDLFIYEDLDFCLRYLQGCRDVRYFPRLQLIRHTPSGKAPDRVKRLETLAQVVEPIRQTAPELAAPLALILARQMIAVNPARAQAVWKELRGYCPDARLPRLLKEALALALSQ